MTRQQEVLAHLGNALLAAQIVERFVALVLEPAKLSAQASNVLDSFAHRTKTNRLVLLKQLLQTFVGHEKLAQKLDADLRRFLKDRNILVHRFQDLGSWDFGKDKDCTSCVTFLRDFIDRAAAVQHQFVSALSIRDVKLKTRVSTAQSKSYAKDYRRLYQPLQVRWDPRIGD